MGREVRRVALGWEPPKQPCRYIHGRMSDPCPGWHWHPHHDESYAHALASWTDGKARWESGEDPDSLADHRRGWSWEDWRGESPDPEYYRPEWPEGTPLGYRYYETVSEGTPISPAFATPQELADWLVEHEGMSPEGAARFVEMGWAPSMMATATTGLITGMQAHDAGVLGREQ
jgi:hypothetical protein